MQQSWTLQLPKSISYPITSIYLENFLEENAKDIGIFISYYFRRQGAVAENVSILKQPDFGAGNSGTVKVQFDLIFFNACLNIHEKEKDQMVLNFKILPEISQIYLTGPYWPEREMDEI